MVIYRLIWVCYNCGHWYILSKNYLRIQYDSTYKLPPSVKNLMEKDLRVQLKCIFQCFYIFGPAVFCILSTWETGKVTSDADFSWSLLNIWVFLGAFERAKWVLLEAQSWYVSYIWRGGFQGARGSIIPKWPPLSPQTSLREKNYPLETWTINLNLWWISCLEELLAHEINSPASKNMSDSASQKAKVQL